MGTQTGIQGPLDAVPGKQGEQICTECERLEAARRRAEAERDYSRVTDCNVLIARHRIVHSTRA
ncbi:hypothetical protein [Streptomyces sp. 8N706]|uniref:hypothetical protein n=1 Tax=Streptomyces sp. 8N706 TaxID=3457416 RepID=UPI003FD5545E